MLPTTSKLPEEKTGEGDILQSAARTIGSTLGRLAVATGLGHVSDSNPVIVKEDSVKKKVRAKRTAAKPRKRSAAT